MKNLVSNINTRLDLIRAELIQAITNKVYDKSRQGYESVFVYDLTIDGKDITQLRYFDGWRCTEIYLCYNDSEGNSDDIKLSTITSIDDLLKICEKLY